MRKLKYGMAINEATAQLMTEDPRVFIMGQGLDSPWSVGTSTLGLNAKFGPERVIDVPIAENGITGIAVGAAIAGMRPIILHPRMDFMYLALDQIANHAANWYYMFGGQVNCPVTIRGIINRGNEQAAQHSQATHAIYSHIPGLKVVMPATPYDAKGLLIAAVRDDNPVVYIDERWLYNNEGDVPEEMYEVPIGRGIVRREGRDITIVALSYLVQEALEAAETLLKDGISAEVIDPRSLKPFDMDLLTESVKKTGRLLVADPGWKTCGFSAEIAALAAEKLFKYLKAPVKRVALPDTPVPSASSLEKAFFPRANEIVNAVREIV